MTRFTKGNIDTPFTELFEGADNTETPRQFIKNSEIEFGIEHADIDSMNEYQLNEYADMLDYLWLK